jgi:hypothetical protein
MDGNLMIGLVGLAVSLASCGLTYWAKRQSERDAWEILGVWTDVSTNLSDVSATLARVASQNVQWHRDFERLVGHHGSLIGILERMFPPGGGR